MGGYAERERDREFGALCRWAARDREREIDAMCSAFAAAMDDPARRLAEACNRESGSAYGEQLLASVADANRRLAEIAAAPGRRGVWGADGSPVSAEFKRQVFAEWERARDEHRARGARGHPVFASASPDGGPSPMLRAIYGLD
jgi:hypothetical protein